ncbi:MAG: putative membrane protein [Candidatus Azotimanducaceae bacterium]|jgi:uncharacterized membrane protein
MNIRIDRLLLKLLGKGVSRLSDEEKEVVDAVLNNETIATDVNALFVKKSTFGEKVSDQLAAFGGSWTFILCFFAIVAGWMAFNSALSGDGGFDPYPYILLNLLLSALAAFQAPIIMMSQNRQSAKDRIETTENYKVSLKTDLEIMALHAKVDAILDSLDDRIGFQYCHCDGLPAIHSPYQEEPKGHSIQQYPVRRIVNSGRGRRRAFRPEVGFEDDWGQGEGKGEG